ncbi:hypothetical protein GCM10009744_65040 [Kribbella alba]|uniref:Uncharacterized protein n=1 Tax=Kribbella alba TaxID=190197 RepID=A0ABP4RVU6_9ACTN
MPDTPDKGAPETVQAALKRTIEINLAREKALTEMDIPGGAAFHSNGIIFSKSGNGTPFSNGLIFSKTGTVSLEEMTTLEGQDLLEGLTSADEATFNQFTSRLMAIKQAKAATKRQTGEE